MQIIVKREGDEHGPYTLDEVTEYLAAGNIVGDDAARVDGTTEWKTINALVAQAKAKPPNKTIAAESPAISGNGGISAVVAHIATTTIVGAVVGQFIEFLMWFAAGTEMSLGGMKLIGGVGFLVGVFTVSSAKGQQSE